MSVIQYIKDMIVGSLTEGIEADLASLIWTVDAKEHCIPTPQEINNALAQIENYSIVRDEDGIRITNDESKDGGSITASDIDKAMESYRSTIERFK